ncbi:flagellar hook-length control protein FliK, partial [Cellulomonas sp. 179-A 4D5 NHS]|uniref:flagellar hook-length control protein FliK n=1 Tax=Cellulomonas sp. 179-A 4D5 NHS TaxID=3142378 RepID=UPI0039A1E92D
RGAEQAAPAPAPQVPLAEQLGARLASVRGLGAGQHLLTLAVDPEHFGPVRVVAHITPDAVRIELLGATDQAREALKASLADLRRDLASAGLDADLELGSRDAGQQAGAQDDARRDALAARGAGTRSTSDPAPGAASDVPARPASPANPAGTLDLLA